ncbi:MmcQ/YjbR family DNA-binding protein [uncultured Friedmanniella sp.]|uniref:MmcQ/YjbR family DNA-binding protein n=1 Tax=uncultured Friedmanniella sp. TaxID=335381 RepID=UPI0035CA8314
MTSEEFLQLVGQLEDVTVTDHGRYSQLRVHGQGFGYVWVRTQTVGLKQPLSEQLALVAERPDVFEVQFTAGSMGWVVVHLGRIERVELAELTLEAWRLTAPAELVERRGLRLPS